MVFLCAGMVRSAVTGAPKKGRPQRRPLIAMP